MNNINTFGKALTTAILAGMLLTACNTMEGVGKDVESAGDKLEDTAAENNNYNHRN